MKTNVIFALIVSLLISAPTLLRAEETPKKEEPKKVEPVDYKKIKEVLKETWAELKRGNFEGSRTRMGEVSFSMASAEYKADKEKDDSLTAKITIMDYASSQSAAMFAAWSKLEIDQESDDGYQKSTKIGDQPGMEQYRNNEKTGTLNLFVADRFIVTLDASNCTKEQFKKLIEAMPVKEIAALKN